MSKVNMPGGKGSKRRPEDTKKIQDNWDKIFTNKYKSLDELKADTKLKVTTR